MSRHWLAQFSLTNVHKGGINIIIYIYLPICVIVIHKINPSKDK